MLKKFEKHLTAIEKVLNAPPRPIVLRHPRFYRDGRPLPPEVIALYKRRRTKEEGRVLFFLARGDGHTYLSPEERKAYQV